ncbi:ATP-binding cassette domain-containing protein [Labrys wisconsinensis]|uniref:Sulfonate transport system ATP-binding protein n=1 Tax=Labrys wisconsinensis TaxID=425677 RepID=A0ABU0JF47_9HYPH|nr:ATP-binding cassette domain-containing protein [Labrys wisconsinensis]MDQ0472899.1 sulfonate transport system ATP-binding protein [Labrys wisconsinensis]
MTLATEFLDDPFFGTGLLGRAARAEEAGPAAPAPAGLPLELAGVAKAFGARQVLRGLDLRVEAGAFVAVVGRSGGGKSTLLRLLAGLERPSAGTVAIDGKPVTGIPAAARLMFQEPRLLPWQRVIANVGIAREPGWRANALAALEAVGLADRAEDWPSLLSGGQRQRVALARALESRPSILLLDEPFGALDALTRREMHQLLARLWRERGFTAVLITHDVDEALALAERVLVLREGAIALDLPVASPREAHGAGEAALKARILAAV